MCASQMDHVVAGAGLLDRRGHLQAVRAGVHRRDERDLLRVRTTYRRPREDADVYRIRAPRENIRRPFLDNLETMNDIATRPRFYDTLTTNCTTGAFMHTRVNPDAPAWSRRIRFSGYVPDYLYEVGRLDTARPSPSSSASRS